MTNDRQSGGKKSARKINERAVALDVIYKTLAGNEYIDKVLSETLERYPSLTSQEKSFIGRLSKGTVERLTEMDYIIDYMVSDSNVRIKSVVKDILRMGIYQIIYMDSVPDSAAVNEAVKLTVYKKVASLKGFVNGVLRNVVRRKDEIPYPSLKKNPIEHYMVWYSMPSWIVKYLLENFGDETEKILQSFYKDKSETTVRCMLSKGDVKEIAVSLIEDKASVKKGNFFDYALRISDYGRLSDLKAFNEGLIQVQDESSMLVGAVLDIEDGMQILDVCAAPGGKSIFAADVLRKKGFLAQGISKESESKAEDNRIDEGEGRVISCDVSKQKVNLIRDNLKRLNIHNVKLKKQDATEYNEEFKEKFDIIIADLPCSGLGVMGKKCDIKYKTKYDDIKSLARLQKQILGNIVRYLKPGGTLIYSTCTITKEENIDNVVWIKKKLGLTPVSIEEKLPERLKGMTGKDGYIQVLPNYADTDGFFVSKFVKSSDS